MVSILVLRASSVTADGETRTRGKSASQAKFTIRDPLTTAGRRRVMDLRLLLKQHIQPGVTLSSTARARPPNARREPGHLA